MIRKNRGTGGSPLSVPYKAVEMMGSKTAFHPGFAAGTGAKTQAPQHGVNNPAYLRQLVKPYPKPIYPNPNAGSAGPGTRQGNPKGGFA